MEPIADWAVYVVPPADHPLYEICASVLGWDCRREQLVERPRLPGISPETLASWVGPATHYGPHATIAGWMRTPLRHRDRIVAELAGIARTFAPIHLERGRFPVPSDFWYAGSSPFPVLVAVFDEPLGALSAVHAEVLVCFNTLAVSRDDEERRRLPVFNTRQRWRIGHYHEPLVLEDFRFHVSFATSLPSIDAADRLRRAIVDATGLFERREHCTWIADELVLFERRPDGFWRLAEFFKLTGAS
jgi:hypothetical protein